MATEFSLNLQKGQVPVVCNLCETETKINWKCLTCELLMCTKCKDKIHIKFKSAEEHKIVDIKEAGQHSKDLDFTNLKCSAHEKQTCCLYCKSCDQIVCPLCISEVHNGHSFVQISEGYSTHVNVLKSVQEVITSNTDKLINREKQIKLLKQNETTKYGKTKTLIQDQNTDLKRAIDQYTQKIMKELDDKWLLTQKVIEEEEKQITSMIENLQKQDTDIEDIINSRETIDVFNKSRTFKVKTIEPSEINFAPLPTFFPGDITEFNVGALQDLTSQFTMTNIQSYTMDIPKVYLLSTSVDGSLWISDQHKIQRVKPVGNNMQVISTYDQQVYGMATTPSNDLLMATNETSVKQISATTGKIMDSIYNVAPLKTTVVHVSKEGKVYIGAKEPGKKPGIRRVSVIKMSKDGVQEQIYELDKNNQQIFHYVDWLTTTSTGSVFVMDKLTKDGKCRILVLEKVGNVLNMYNGHPKINAQSNDFMPVFMVTTPSDNVIVPDKDIHILHLLNCTGHLISYLNTRNIGITHPCSLVYTPSGQLFIGCSRSKGSTENSKLYKVAVSGI